MLATPAQRLRGRFGRSCLVGTDLRTARRKRVASKTARCAFQAKGSPSCADLTAMEAQRRDKRNVLALLPEKCRERCLALAALTLFSASAGSLATNVGDPAVPGTLDHAALSAGFKVER